MLHLIVSTIWGLKTHFALAQFPMLTLAASVLMIGRYIKVLVEVTESYLVSGNGRGRGPQVWNLSSTDQV